MVSRAQDLGFDLNELLVRPMAFASVPSSCKLQGLHFLSSPMALNKKGASFPKLQHE